MAVVEELKSPGVKISTEDLNLIYAWLLNTQQSPCTKASVASHAYVDDRSRKTVNEADL